MSDLRHSFADPVELIADPLQRAEREAQNGVRQFNEAMDMVKASLSSEKPFKLRQAHILRLHFQALDGLHPLAGTYRNSAVTIGKSSHTPPPHSEVADLTAEMCDYVQAHWNDCDAVHLAAYVLWRLNWIHPFADGNGRTARAASYVILNVHCRQLLPGTPTIADQIAADKQAYYAELEKADFSWAHGALRLASLENMLENMLKIQLAAARKAAEGQD